MFQCLCVCYSSAFGIRNLIIQTSESKARTIQQASNATVPESLREVKSRWGAVRNGHNNPLSKTRKQQCHTYCEAVRSRVERTTDAAGTIPDGLRGSSALRSDKIPTSGLKTGCRKAIMSMESVFTSSGCSAVWLARLTGGQKVVGSNPIIPTSSLSKSYAIKLLLLYRHQHYPL